MVATHRPAEQTDDDSPAARFLRLRAQTEALAAPLTAEDQSAQAMPDSSPTKWHLAHTSWFFETFLLVPHLPGYRFFHPAFRQLFNSYYDAVGPRPARAQRGLLTRPGLDEVMAYRHHVTMAMLALLARGDEALADVVALGQAHEEQHQELILTDILALFAANPLKPAYRPLVPAPTQRRPPPPPLRWLEFGGGVTALGHAGPGFAFDNEGPRHAALLAPYRLACRAVTNGEWLAFMAGGGYRRPSLWLADGWAVAQAEGWTAPATWTERGSAWWSMTLAGPQPVDEAAPVCHVSYYEADAFARWCGHRLPTEAEWEAAASAPPDDAPSDNAPAPAEAPRVNDLATGLLRPQPAVDGPALAQMFGDVWEWTASPYLAYPGFRAAAGALGEYNGKFMANQMVLRGGACVTPHGHVRPTYRNFFYPQARWQFTGLRLAEDA